MDLSAILLFAAVLAVATATPGPTVAVLVARVLTLGPAHNIGFAIGLATFAELVVLLTLVYSAVLAAYMIGASYARRLVTSPRTMRYANRGSAVVMAGTAAIVASRS